MMSQIHEVAIPDIGGASGVDVIEILVKKGDRIEIDTPLVTLESDKASMEIPSSAVGVVDSIRLKVGDKVSQGDVILMLQTEATAKPVEKSDPVIESKPIESQLDSPQESNVVAVLQVSQEPVLTKVMELMPSSTDAVFAGPGVRRFARELGIQLEDVAGTGPKSRITKDDLQRYVKNRLSQPTTAGSAVVPAQPKIDFSQFGAVEVQPLNKIKRLTGTNLHRSWVTVPHVTQFDEADITELEAFRTKEVEGNPSADYKLTVLAFVCKVVTKALAAFPQFNASLDPQGENLIYKKYTNIGIAVDTPNGLVVPVIKSINALSVIDIAKEMARLSAKARDKALMPGDMSGGCFTISSLGGIGGTAFTPIVNNPEVAILGLSRSSIKPVYQSGEFKPRLMLPLSLSYDHRVIDGAEAARFCRYLTENLADIRKVLL
jgi:pyruvate dehydrogenase E2 component (dihydrolipoamide acetyltransferase)